MEPFRCRLDWCQLVSTNAYTCNIACIKIKLSNQNIKWKINNYVTITLWDVFAKSIYEMDKFWRVFLPLWAHGDSFTILHSLLVPGIIFVTGAGLDSDFPFDYLTNGIMWIWFQLYIIILVSFGALVHMEGPKPKPFCTYMAEIPKNTRFRADSYWNVLPWIYHHSLAHFYSWVINDDAFIMTMSLSAALTLPHKNSLIWSSKPVVRTT